MVTSTPKGISQDDTGYWEGAAGDMENSYGNSFIAFAATWSDDSIGDCFS